MRCAKRTTHAVSGVFCRPSAARPNCIRWKRSACREDVKIDDRHGTDERCLHARDAQTHTHTHTRKYKYEQNSLY